MPNYCDFYMRIKGEKQNVYKFATWLSADYNYCDGKPEIYVEIDGKKMSTEHHIGWRVFECYFEEDVFDKGYFGKEDIITLSLSGYCAWSVNSCMFDGPFTYYADNHNECIEKYGEDKSLTLPMACEKLNLEVEVFSSEPGMCFSEHYRIDSNGELTIDEETGYVETFIDEYETYDDFVKARDNCNLISMEAFNQAKSKGEDIVISCSWLKDGEWPYELE